MATAQTPEVQRLIDESESQNNQQHFETAVQIAQQAIDLSRATSDKKGLARAYLGLESGLTATAGVSSMPPLTAAKQRRGRLLRRNRRYRVPDFQPATWPCSSLRDQGKLDEALAFYNRALDISKSTGDKKGEASTLRVMAIAPIA